MDGGSRFKGVNFFKPSDDIWGLVRWHSRLDPFLYSEPLTNLTSYFGAGGISDEVPKNPLNDAKCMRVCKCGNKMWNLNESDSNAVSTQANDRIEPEPTKYSQRSRQAVRTRISSRRSAHVRAYATRLGSVHLPGDTRQTRVRRSRHLPFYNPEVEGR
ncbi:hypothetical protein CRG98_016518 [Punica granatum]|uniref:Uncharacterized protein n=1 Tax=Punica granatum TaxID=22663 RepID=A0A2I0K3E1_PUNGR|nr:hypothetical protein CRG98_016518 [Punica granatum]